MISERLDLYKKLKKGPEPMEALAAYGKPTASLRQTYGRKWLRVLVSDVWQVMTSADPFMSYGKTYGKPTANLRQCGFCYLYCTSHIVEYLVWGLLVLIYENKCF